MQKLDGRLGSRFQAPIRRSRHYLVAEWYSSRGQSPRRSPDEPRCTPAGRGINDPDPAVTVADQVIDSPVACHCFVDDDPRAAVCAIAVNKHHRS